MNYDFRDKVVMISGGSRGIGRATAIAFARAGAGVSIASSNPDNVQAAVAELREIALAAGSVGVLGVAADLALAEGVQSFVDQTLAHFGAADVLVNNVGAAKSGPFLELTDEMLLSAWTLKLLCAIRLTRALVPVMERRGGGAVVNVAGNSGKEPEPQNVAVATTNAGLRVFTRGVCSDLARRGIVINLVTPGKVRTERMFQQAEREARARGITAQQVLDQRVSETPTGRITEPEEVADTILFLASRRVPNLTGAEIVLDGGVTRSL